ncbi:MAG: GGDEF domain-containing protein [Acidobacteria bacterium]|nr:GGDEF domain-containing protein [Acidobacteriota bacterium]
MTTSPHPRGAILEAALAATRRLDRDGAFAAVAEHALGLFGGLYALGFALGPAGDDYECCAAAGVAPTARIAKALAVLDAGLVRHLAPAGPALLDDAEVLLPTGEQEGLPPLGGALLVPLAAARGPAGLVVLIAAKDELLASGAAAAAAEFARELEPALENLRTVESLRELVIRDDTADCFNRRYLDQSLDDEVERCRRFGGSFALIFIDMDNLKEVNTVYGHAAGSRVLYEASVRMARSIRSIDRLYRYGGDEFVIILPGTGLEGAREVADRIRRELSRTPYEATPGAQVRLSASAGVAAWPDHGPSARSVIEAGDGAMRRVKDAGKDGVGVARRGERAGDGP